MSYILNDLPTIEDKLGRIDLVERICTQLVNSHPPLVVGVHGDWGAGKTSFLRQIQFYLDGGQSTRRLGSLKKAVYADKVATVWFDAWRYQYEPVPIVALLHAVRDRLSMIQKAVSQGKKLAEVTTRSLLSNFSEITNVIGIEGLAKTAQEQGELWEKRNYSERLKADDIRHYLEGSIGELLGGRGKIVIFIDDLDRCDGDMATKLLDSLKVYLDLKNCVFVLGLNQHAVQDAISNKLGSEGARKAGIYLEKICQNVWRLPLIDNTGRVFCDWISDRYIGRSLYTLFEDDDGLDRKLLPPNPRRLKGFANLANRNLDVLKTHIGRSRVGEVVSESDAVRMKMWIIAIYIYQFFPDLFVKWRYSPAFFDGLREWVLGLRPEATEFKEVVLPSTYETDDNSPVPAFRASNNFPDPGDPHVFWVASIVATMPMEVRGENFVDLLRAIK